VREYSLIAVLVLGLIVPGASTFAAEDFQMVQLAMPRCAGRAESVRVQVTTGPLPRGARLVVIAETGEILGAVAPFPPGGRSNSATVPVPRSAVVDGHVRLRLQVIEPDTPARAPRPGEVEHLDLVVVPQSE
jgi:hypothetical protein